MTEATGVPVVTVQPLASPPVVKPGWKTSEFWFRAAATLLTVLFAADVIPTSGQLMKLAVVAALWLTAEGYAVNRTVIKNAAVMVALFLVAFPLHGCSAPQRAIEHAEVRCLETDVLEVLAMLGSGTESAEPVLLPSQAKCIIDALHTVTTVPTTNLLDGGTKPLDATGVSQ